MSTVIARNRFRMYTAFIAQDGRRILNIADIVDGRQQCVSIEMDDADVAGVAMEDHSIVERLLRQGRRLACALPTPSAGEPVMPYGFSKAA